MNDPLPDLYERKALNETAIRAIIRDAVGETLGSLGVDTRQPAELQADLYYLRRLRRAGDEMRSVVRHSVLTLLVSAALYLLWEAVRRQLLTEG